MAVSTVQPKEDYTGTGITGPYPFPHFMVASTDLVVALDNVEQSSGYTVSGSGSSWNVDFTSAIASGVKIVLRRSTSITQTSNYQTNDVAASSRFESDYDKGTAIDQELKVELDTKLGYSVNEGGVVAADTVLPLRSDRTSKAFTWDSNGYPQASTLDTNSLSNNALNITFDPAGASATATTVEAKLRERVSVKDFAAAGTYTTDDTAAIQAAFDYIKTVGGVLEIPAGNYKVTSLDFSSSSTYEIQIIGSSRKDTTLNFTNTTGDIFDLEGSRFIRFKNLNILNQAGEPTSGELFSVNNADDIWFEDMRISSAYDGIVISNTSSNIHLTRCEFLRYTTYTWNWAVRIVGACSNIRMTDCSLQTSATATGGFVSVEDSSGGVDTLRMLRCSAQKQSSGLIPECVVIENGEFVTMTDCNFEGGVASAVGIKIEGGTNININNAHCVSNLVGVSITGGAGISITGGEMYFNDNEGINITGGSDITINGTRLLDNGRDTADTYAALYASAPVSDLTVVNSRVASVRGDTVDLLNGMTLDDGIGGNLVISNNEIEDGYFSGQAIAHTFPSAGTSSNKVGIFNNGGHNQELLLNHARVRTTDATETTLWSRTLNDNEHLTLRVVVRGQGSSGTATVGYERIATVYRDGGSAVLLGSVSSTHTAEWNASADCSIDVDSNDVRVRVTGVGGNTIDWGCNVSILGAVSAG